jgi:type VI protein secretion system component VasF
MMKRVVLSHTLASTPAGRTLPTGGNGRFSPPPPGSRSAEQIRNDIVQQRQQLSRSVDALRNRWVQVTDVRRQIREHRTELAVGAAVVGFLIGGAVALSRRRG